MQVPTTLLAMVDAAVGGKTGIDVPAGKNLVGAFKWPAMVVADPDVLRTLPEDVLRAGMAEAVKHAAIADAGHLSWVEAQAEALVQRTAGPLAELFGRSIEIKAGVVGADPLESGRKFGAVRVPTDIGGITFQIQLRATYFGTTLFKCPHGGGTRELDSTRHKPRGHFAFIET